MADGDNILDAFVNVEVDSAVLANAEEAVKAAVERMQRMFLGISTTAGQTTAQVSAAAARLRGGAGGGAGGGGGGGGAGGGNQQNAQAQQLARDFDLAKRAARDLTEDVRILRGVVSNTGSDELAEQLQRVNNELRRGVTELSDSSRDRDLFNHSENLANLQRTLDLLQNIGGEVQNIQSESARRTFLRSQSSDLRQQFTQDLGRFQRQDRLDSSLTRGNAMSGDQKRILAEIKKRVEDIKIEFLQLSNAAELSNAEIDRMRVLAGGLADATQQAGALRGEIAKTGSSMNSLQNNAYQIGQAFEDAAVGFQLNGVAGAVRGAANNISFVLNNLSRTEGAQRLLGARIANNLGLIAGLGGAAALLFLAPFVEWLQTLNDIDLKMRDITDILQRDLSNVKLTVEVEASIRDLQRSIRDSTSAEDLLGEIFNTAQTANDTGRDIVKTILGFSESEVIGDINKMFIVRFLLKSNFKGILPKECDWPGL